MKMTMHEPITLAEAARRSGLAHTTLRQAALRGRLRAQKIGRDWLTTPHDLDQYLADRQTWKHHHPKEEDDE